MSVSKPCSPTRTSPPTGELMDEAIASYRRIDALTEPKRP